LNPYFERLRNPKDRTTENVELALLWDEAVILAHLERTGHSLEPGARYTTSDAERAQSILPLLLKKDGE
jgi:hypothetical protein